MKVGTIGNGVIVHDFLEALYELKKERDVECAAMLALREADMEGTRKLADEFGVTKVYANIEEFLNDETIQFVYIALPNAFHFEYALKALCHGKHVFLEKPFVPTVKQAKKLIAAAKEHHVMIFEMITTLYFPNFLSLKERLPEIGNITLAECNFSHVSGKYKELVEGKNPNVFSLNMCAGTMADMGIYAIHFILNLFGKPSQAKYFANLHSTGIDTSGMMMMQWDELCAVCISSKHSRGRNALILQGDKGYISCDCGGNFITGYTIVKGKEEEYVNVQEDKPRLYFELAAFEEMFRKEDFEGCYRILDYTEMVVSVCEKARKEAGIIYPADQEVM